MKKAFYEKSFWLHEFFTHLAVICVFAAKAASLPLHANVHEKSRLYT